MSSVPLGRIGYWWSEKKSRKFNVQEFSNVCRSYGFELVKIDLNRPLEDQGPFVAVVQKLTDYVIKAESGDIQASAACEEFQKYVDSHPEMIVIDPLPRIKKLTDRYKQYKCIVSELNKRDDVFIPAFVEITTTNVSENIVKMKAAGVDFPIVCKPTLAHGSTAHQMSLIFNEKGLKDVIPPCVAQKFINHNAVLYKLFTIGNKYYMSERPSIKNFTAGDQKTIFFNSHDISKRYSASELNALDDDEEQHMSYVLPEKEKMDFIVETLYKCLGIDLLGIDVIIDNKTGHYGVVDVNVFPGYDEVDDFFKLLCELIIERISNKNSGENKAECKPRLNQFVVTPRGSQKFNFDFSNVSNGPSKIIQSIPTSFCYPVSTSCLNGVDSERKHTKTVNLCESPVNSQCFHSQDCVQEDSGVETSDSCDEKKETYHRTIKHLHSRPNNSITVAVDSSS